MKRIVITVLILLSFFGCYKNNNLVEGDCVIITIEEGLIDQLEYYIAGEQIKKLGYKVKYDTSWYKRVAYSNAGLKSRFVLSKLKAFISFWSDSIMDKKKSFNSRTLQLKQAFPYIDFIEASDEEVKFYKKHFRFPKRKGYWRFGDNIKPPLYMPMHIDKWRFCKEVSAGMLRFNEQNIVQQECYEYFHFEDSIFDDKNLKILQRIRKEKCPVGIHVRRGDDAVRGVASSVEYYVKAANKVKELFPDASFFFISDEPNYVKNELLPIFDSKIKIEIIDINDVNTSYKDLFLMSECKHQVRSFGSMGAIAYLINRYPGKKLISPSVVRVYSNIKPDFIIEV
jgi:hypothetical protein